MEYRVTTGSPCAHARSVPVGVARKRSMKSAGWRDCSGVAARPRRQNLPGINHAASLRGRRVGDVRVGQDGARSMKVTGPSGVGSAQAPAPGARRRAAKASASRAAGAPPGPARPPRSRDVSGVDGRRGPAGPAGRRRPTGAQAPRGRPGRPHPRRARRPEGGAAGRRPVAATIWTACAARCATSAPRPTTRSWRRCSTRSKLRAAVEVAKLEVAAPCGLIAALSGAAD